MNKKGIILIIVAVILVVAAIFAACAVFSDNTKKPAETDDPAPVSTPEEKPSETETKAVLYFASEDGMSFVTEERMMKIENGASAAEKITEALVGGPEVSGAYPTLNKSTAILGVSVKDKIADVKMGDNFISLNTGGSTKEFLAIYSIVNSLTELDGIDAVTFSYGGNPVYEFGSFYFDEPCVKKMSVNEL